MTELWPYLVLVLVGFLPNEIWRVLGLVLARGLNEDSEIVVWSRAVATAILAGVIAKLILFSAGALAGIPLGVRVGAAVCGFLAFLAVKRSVFVGVAAGEAALFGCVSAFLDSVEPVFGQSCANQPAAIAAASFLAFSASTSGFSFSLAGGFMATPALRGMTCTCRWNTTCPPAPSLNCWMVMPSAAKAVIAALAIFCATCHHMREIVGADVEDVARRRLRQHQRVAGRARHDVEEGERLVVLVDLVAGQFAAQDLGEDVVRIVARHRRLPARDSTSHVLLDQILAERRRRRKLFAGRLHIGALARQILGHRPPQRRIGDEMRGIGGFRQIAARQLVLALRAGLDARELVGNRVVDGLVIAQLEMQERVVLDGAPVAAVDRVARRGN